MSLLQRLGHTRATELRGWSIYRSDFHGRECWVARRHGVSMNAHCYDAIVRMILTRQ